MDRSQKIKEMAVAGATFSYTCRNPFTGEKTSTTVSGDKFTGKTMWLTALPPPALPGSR